MRKTLVLGLAIALLQAVPALASILGATATTGVRNTYRDESVESIADLDKSGTFSVGDVLYGFVQIVAKTTPNALSISPSGSGSLYAVFSTQVASIVPTVNGATTTYVVTLAPTTNPLATFTNGRGLTLSQLTGVSTAGAMAVVYEGVPTDLFTTSPGDVNGDGQVDTRDYVKAASMAPDAANPDLILGPGAGATSWTETFAVPTGTDPFANLTLLWNLNNSAPLGLNGFSADLTKLGGSFKLFTPSATVQTDGTDPHFGGLFDLTVQAGNVLGANDIQSTQPGGLGTQPTGPWFKSISDGAGNTYAQYGTSDHAQFNLTPAIPEPISLIVWSLLIGSVGTVVWLRRRKV